ncbi:hypothetical protein K7472_09670 [Streptomyces sp. PTM05]|uniref:Uncharacterized protein n=1 Tax=Streptantibioticus parmotrematis TaxID=2873249 RepID=A0ABS7QPI9_9ACTN|nr:hypothetical protein [Streptantibioticus parmotrematis]
MAKPSGALVGCSRAASLPPDKRTSSGAHDFAHGFALWNGDDQMMNRNRAVGSDAVRRSCCGPSGRERAGSAVGAVACVFSQLPAVFAADRVEQGADVVTHAASQVGAAETVADTQEEVVEFTVPGRVGEVIDHTGRLPSSPLRQFPVPLVGGAVSQDCP